MAKALDQLLDLLDLEQNEVNIFRGRSPDERRQRVFGGQVAGQALVAAGRTVPADRPVHSMHAAKGLEWDAVFLPGLVEGLVPIVHARTAEAIEEERRLLYVAVTRARQYLYLSWSPARAPGGPAARQRSRFLDDVRLGRRGG